MTERLDPDLETLDIGSIAKYLQVSASTIETRLRKCQFPKPIRIGVQRRWLKTQIVEWLRAGGNTAPAPGGTV